MKPDPIKKNRLSALRIVAVYAVLGAAWVFLSDLLSQILAWKYADAALDSVFIVVSSVTIYYRIVASFNRNRQMEEKLERNEERLKLALAASKMGVWEWNIITDKLFWSPECFDIYGAESFNGTLESFTNLLHPDDAGYVMAAARKALADNIPNIMQYRIIRSDGQVRWLSDHSRPSCNGMGTPQCLVGTVQDITERKLAEEALLQSEEKNRAVLEYQTEIITRYRPDGTYTFVNDAYCRIFGRAREELLENSWHPDAFPEDIALIESQLQKMSPGHPVVVIENRVITVAAEIRWMQFVNRGLYDNDGKLVETQSVGRDITALKLAEEEIKRKENQLQIIIDAVPALISYVDSDFRYRMVNRSYNLWFNKSTDRICGCHVRDLLGDRYWEKNRPLLELALAGETVSFETELPNLSGGMQKFAATYIPHHDHGGRVIGVVVMALDITRQKQDEVSLRRYAQHVIVLEEKMRRQLAAELHDELGRDLTTLGLNFTIISNALSEEAREKLGERVEDSACIIEEMSRTVRSMMIRLRPPVLDEYGLAAALRNYADQISKRTGIAVDVQLDAIEPRLSEEIETNLFRIAQEALNNITKHAEATSVTLKLEICGAGYKILISDDGKGFDSLIIKKSDSNIGWGLTIMRERAESVGARFSLDSNPGRGTVVSVEIGVD